jgi:DNA repair exonuclease SbcCD ATPase subunit
MKTLTVSVHQAPAKLDQELAGLRSELRETEGSLSKARQKRKFLEARSVAIATQRQRVRQLYLFVGRVEQALENVVASQNVDDLRVRVAQLAQNIARLKRDLDPRSQRERLEAAIDKVSARIAHYAGILKLEHASENVKLNVRELTLQFKSLSGRTDYLWEVGSGQNWVGYHVAGSSPNLARSKMLHLHHL